MKYFVLITLLFYSFSISSEEKENHFLSLKCNENFKQDSGEYPSRWRKSKGNKVAGVGDYFYIDVYLLEDFITEKNDEEWIAEFGKAKTVIYYEDWRGYIHSTILNDEGVDEGRTLKVHPEYFFIFNGAHTISLDRIENGDDRYIHHSNHGFLDWHLVDIDRLDLGISILLHHHPDKDGPYTFEYSTNGVDNVFSRFGFYDVLKKTECYKAQEGDGIKWMSQTNDALDREKSEKEKQKRKEVLEKRKL